MSIPDNKPELFIIDDDDDLRDSLEAYFSQLGFKVSVFSSGLELLAVYPATFAGVIVCDLKMPGMSGLELLNVLRDNGELPSFILLTAFGDIPTTVKAMQLGAYDFLEKPFDPQRLQEKIIEAAQAKRSAQQSFPLDEQKKLREHVEHFEKSLLEQALRECEGHIGKVCELLHIPRRTLNEKLVKHQINRHDYLL